MQTNEDMQKDYWQCFKDTGDIEQYLKYKNASQSIKKEDTNADNNKWSGITGN